MNYTNINTPYIKSENRIKKLNKNESDFIKKLIIEETIKVLNLHNFDINLKGKLFENINNVNIDENINHIAYVKYINNTIFFNSDIFSKDLFSNNNYLIENPFYKKLFSMAGLITLANQNNSEDINYALSTYFITDNKNIEKIYFNDISYNTYSSFHSISENIIRILSIILGEDSIKKAFVNGENNLKKDLNNTINNENLVFKLFTSFNNLLYIKNQIYSDKHTYYLLSGWYYSKVKPLLNEKVGYNYIDFDRLRIVNEIENNDFCMFDEETKNNIIKLLEMFDKNFISGYPISKNDKDQTFTFEEKIERLINYSKRDIEIDLFEKFKYFLNNLLQTFVFILEELLKKNLIDKEEINEILLLMNFEKNDKIFNDIQIINLIRKKGWTK